MTMKDKQLTIEKLDHIREVRSHEISTQEISTKKIALFLCSYVFSVCKKVGVS